MTALVKWLICVLFAVAALSGCGSDAPNEQSAPEFAFRSFRSALLTRNYPAVWAFLGPETRSELEARAAAFEDAGRRVQHPAELLVVGWVPSEADIDSVERLHFDEERAVLRIATVFEHEADIELTRDGDAWRIELQMPSTEVLND